MKVLMFCNGMLTQIARHLSVKEDSFGGWLDGLSGALLEKPGIELSAAFPVWGLKTEISGTADNLAYYGFPQKERNIENYNKDIEVYVKTIITNVNPDVIHIFGTEFPHTLAIVNVCENLGILSKVLLNIQGLISVIAGHYYAGLPHKAVNGYTLRDIIRQDNIRQQANTFKRRGVFEVEAIKKVRHISGRTDWDRACTSRINPNAQYHFCNETLRDEFYKKSRDISKRERHSIFMSHAGYPIKGLHFVLEALAQIIKKYPGAHLYIAGDDITRSDAPLSQKLRISYYGAYIKKLIQKHQLKKHITYTGILDEKAMCERFLKSHVFVSASSIENSSNSLCEAMLLGVPSVASYAGGVSSLMKHGEEGFLYQHDAPYMLAHYVCGIFGDDDLALRLSNNAGARARKTHDRAGNAQRMTEIYRIVTFARHS